MTKPDPYIEILRYGSTMESVNPDTLLEYLNNKKIYFHPDQQTTRYTTIFRNIFCVAFEDGLGNRPDLNSSGTLYRLKLEAFSQLFSYDSLQQAKADSEIARIESLQATKIATRSFYVAIAIGLLQIIVALALSFK